MSRMILSSVLAGMLCACGGPEPPIEGPTRTTSEPVPNIVVSATLPDVEEDQEPLVLDDGETVTVGSVKRLLRSIRSNRTIKLRAGTYDLDAVPHTEHDFVRWEKVYDGQEAVIEGVENLTIEAAGSIRPEILARPRYAFVLRLRDVKNVTLKNLVLGHTPEGGCTGGVVGVETSENVAIEGSDLFGSGTVGVSLEDVTHFAFDESKIRECTYGIARIAGSSDVLFSDATFDDNAEFDLVEIENTPGVRFERCTFSNNRVNKGYGHVFFKLDSSSTAVVTDSKFEKNNFDQLTNDKSRLKVVGGQAGGWAQQQLNKPDPQLNQIYALARYKQWIVAGTQAGIVFWNPATGSVDALHKAYISQDLEVRGKYLWAGTYRSILRFDGLKAKSYLRTQKTRGGKLVIGPKGELLVHQNKSPQLPHHWWLYDDKNDRFSAMPASSANHAPAMLGGFTLGDFYDVVVRRNGEVWAIDFLSTVARHRLRAPGAGTTTKMGLGSASYPGSDPRQFYLSPRGRLWVVDFRSGFLRFDDNKKVFVKDPTVNDKGSAMAVDAQRNRTWMLHYTDGLHLVVNGAAKRFFPLQHLQYMRDLLLDRDGSVWVGGWNALVHISRQGSKGWRERSHVVSLSTLGPGVKP